jgi:hypothetical protein
MQDCTKSQNMSIKKYEIYARALIDAVNRFPGSMQTMKDLLLRIQNGFQSALSDIRDSLQMTQDNFNKINLGLKY